MKKTLGWLVLIALLLLTSACSAPQTPPDAAVDVPPQSEPELIGRMVTCEDFLAEFPKRVSLDDYNVESSDDGSLRSYVYTAKTDCEIEAAPHNFRVEIDGISLTLPLTVRELTERGFALTEKIGEEGPVDLSTAVRSGTFRVQTPRGNTFTIYAISKDYLPTSPEELIVMQVSCEFYQESIRYGEGERDDAPDITFFQNVSGDSTVDGIVRELKTPREIRFTQALSNGVTTLSDLQLTFWFSNETHWGNLDVIAHAVRDEAVERTSYVSSLSYWIDYESIRESG